MKMKKGDLLLCKDGETEVEIVGFDDNSISVLYNGKVHKRPKSCIGKTLHYQNVCWNCGSRVTSLECDICNYCGWYICSVCGSCHQGWCVYHARGFDKNGIHRNGTRFSYAGYDVHGYDCEGYNEKGYNCVGYNREGYDKDGYNREGYDKDGYNREGYDKDGYDREGYDKDGHSAYTKELIEQGDIFLEKEEFEQALNCYNQAHMQNDPYGTYKLAECFRIAFLKQNLDNIDYINCREYAREAIDLYAIAYERCENYARKAIDVYAIADGYAIADEELKGIVFRLFPILKTILMNRLFVKRLINDAKCDLPDETLIIQALQKNSKTHPFLQGNRFAMFLSADIHKKVLFLLRIAKDEHAEKYLKIAASIKAYKHSCSEILYGHESGEILQCLIDAKHFGAKFDVSNMYTKLHTVDGKRPPNEPGIWSDADPISHYDQKDSPYKEDFYYGERELWRDEDDYSKEGYVGDEIYYCDLEDHYFNHYEDK